MYLYELIQEVGKETVATMQRELGPGYISLPACPTKEHPFAKYMSPDTLAKILKEQAPGRVWIGSSLVMAARNNKIIARRRYGEPAEDLAAEYGVTSRHVRAITQGMSSTYYGLWARRQRAEKQFNEDQLELFKEKASG